MTAIGIDLGTTNCCMAIVRNGKVDVIPYSLDSRTMPSYISFWKNELLFGHLAKTRLLNNLENTVYDVKRLIGRKLSDPEVESRLNKWNFKIVNHEGKLAVNVKQNGERKFYTPEELSGLILKDLKYRAELYLDKPVSNAVITVPTYFNDAQRQATIDAGKIAGFEKVKLLTEPTAAALAYNTANPTTKKRTVLVFDFGGGTFDVSLVECVGSETKVVAIDGNLNMGGNDIDDALLDHVIAEYGLELQGKLLFRLKKMCEERKRLLAETEEAILDLSEFCEDHEEVTLSRETFNKVSENIFNEATEVVERCLKNSDTSIDDVDEILMIGGSSKIFRIKELLEQHFGKPLKNNINPDEAVAVGAAIHASSWTDSTFSNVKFVDICPYSLGVAVKNEQPLAPGETDNGHLMCVMIPKHTKVPTKVTRDYSTATDNQEVIGIKIYSGENFYVDKNKFLGSVVISGLKPAPKGEVDVDVTYELDENGILNVTVLDPESNNAEKLTVQLEKGSFTTEELRNKTDVIQKQFNESLLVQDFKRRKTRLAELCCDSELQKRCREDCDEALSWLDGLDYSTENSRLLDEKLDSLRGKIEE